MHVCAGVFLKIQFLLVAGRSRGYKAGDRCPLPPAAPEPPWMGLPHLEHEGMRLPPTLRDSLSGAQPSRLQPQWII